VQTDSQYKNFKEYELRTNNLSKTITDNILFPFATCITAKLLEYNMAVHNRQQLQVSNACCNVVLTISTVWCVKNSNNYNLDLTSMESQQQKLNFSYEQN